MSNPIDFEKEWYNIPLDSRPSEIEWAKSIAARVEHSTIERCCSLCEGIERLYSPAPSDAAKGTSHD